MVGRIKKKRKKKEKGKKWLEELKRNKVKIKEVQMNDERS